MYLDPRHQLFPRLVWSPLRTPKLPVTISPSTGMKCLQVRVDAATICGVLGTYFFFGTAVQFILSPVDDYIPVAKFSAMKTAIIAAATKETHNRLALTEARSSFYGAPLYTTLQVCLSNSGLALPTASMNIFSIVALCLISCRPALSLNSKRTPTEAGLHVRDGPSQTVSLSLPSPTSTSPSVTSAYATYSQKCGTDLNTATQAALTTYESISTQPNASITDPSFQSWASVNYPDYMQAVHACQIAQLDYQDALAQAASSSAGPSSATPSSTPPSQPSSSSPSASATSSSPAQPSHSKPASATFHGPSWVLALSGLAAAIYIS
ncbi:hypothetical protein B0H11DRAFT_1277413 [Mycena galericulata]|nr:hypothetical protein B0H11DRAFT_1277413 [Mycena galericulata]